MLPFPVHIYFEIVALLTSLVFWNKIKCSKLKYFVFFLMFVVCVELTGRYIRKVLHQPNVWLYNLSIPIEYLFYSFIFYLHYKTNSFRVLAAWFLVLFTLFVGINLIFVSGLISFNTQAVTVGSFFMILFSLLFFYDLYLKFDSGIVLMEPMFWIASGILIFNAGEFTYNLFSPYLVNRGFDNAARLFTTINNKLIWVLYSLLTIAFLCKKTSMTYRKA